MHAYNLKIREAIKDGTFLNHIKNTFLPYVDEIEHLSLWGAEPTINGDLFPQFISSMLDAFPKIKEFMFSTNALVGWEPLYNNFCVPLIEYAEKNERPLHWEVQFSLDGPPEFNDVSRHPGATSNTLHTAFTLMEKIPKNCKYFSLSVVTKATLDISYMRLMNQEGLSKFQWYYDFMN
jgi:sulfatase maturation enzyme AslB (radical SAM superfamily)